MRGAAEKTNKNRAVKARRKEAGFKRPSQADESAVRDIRRLEVFAQKDPRLRIARRRSFTEKNRDALAMRVHLQNFHKRQNLLGPAQYKGEDVVYVLLSNILAEERRMQAYMGKKSATYDA